MGLLTVFANFRIDSEERFLRMQDSFRSFRDADIHKWVINIRGPLRNQATEFLRSNLGSRLTLHAKDSKEGWLRDSAGMLRDIDTEYVFVWIEDHICIAGIGYFNQVIREMQRFDADNLSYTFFHHGDGLRSLARVPSTESDAIVVVNYDRQAHGKRMKEIKTSGLICTTFIVSCPSILKRSLFSRIVLANDPLIKRWPVETPFDFEKNQRDVHWLPMRVGYPKREFFVSIDDDHGREAHSLTSRGLYPQRVSRDSLVEIRERHLQSTSSMLRKRVLYYYREVVNTAYSRVIGPITARRDGSGGSRNGHWADK